MFSVGQRVWHRDGQHSGKVLECVAGRVYVEQDNGAEADFRASDLSLTPPQGARSHTIRPSDPRESASPAAQVIPNRTLTTADITPEHVRVLAVVPVRTLQAIAAVFERRPNAGKFSALDTAGKLNAITAITAVPYRVMRQHTGSPGELGLLMGKGLADSRRGM